MDGKRFLGDVTAGLTVSFAAISLGAAFGAMSGQRCICRHDRRCRHPYYNFGFWRYKTASIGANGAHDGSFSAYGSICVR